MFSIVMPLWNKQHTVATTVASALGQTFEDFELIIVDDGSTDGSMEVLSGFDDLRIRRMAQPNAGPGAARNAGIAAARHDWIAFLDADDIWLPDHLAELDRVRVRFPDAGLIAASIILSDRDGSYRLPVSNGHRIETINHFEAASRGKSLFTTSSVSIPKTSYLAFGGFGDAPAGQDMEYWARIALDRPVALSSRVTTVYRIGTGGIGDTVRNLWWGRELRQMSDLDPSVALLIERAPDIRCPALRQAVDRYVDHRVRTCVRSSARLGDLRTLRSLPRLASRPLAPGDRLIVAAARLPRPVALVLYSIGFRLKAFIRSLRKIRPRHS